MRLRLKKSACLSDASEYGSGDDSGGGKANASLPRDGGDGGNQDRPAARHGISAESVAEVGEGKSQGALAVCLVGLIYLVYLVYLVVLVEQNKPDRPDEPDKPSCLS